MAAEWTPMRWPAAWKSVSSLDLLKGTAINCLVIAKGGDMAEVASRAEDAGLHVVEPGSPPAGVTIVKGLWPGMRLSHSGGGNDASAGPTGEPWVDSNGWKVRLNQAINQATNPGSQVWVAATPTVPMSNTASYVVALADSAASGGRWIVSLDDKLASGVAAQESRALDTWKRLTAAAGFFSTHKSWADYLPQAFLGIVSDFKSPQSHEALNLVARSNQQYRVIPVSTVSGSSFAHLRAVVYPDAEPPTTKVREAIETFVLTGGLLIAGPKWREVKGSTSASSDHPRFTVRTLGKGRVAIAKQSLDDPYLLASDSASLMSHRYELLRFWNSGPVGSNYGVAPDARRALVQIVFYASHSMDSAAVRIVGPYRAARLLTIEQKEPRAVTYKLQEGAIEVHLPRVSQYAAVELSMA